MFSFFGAWLHSHSQTAQARQIAEINRRCVYRAAHRVERGKLVLDSMRQRDMSAAGLLFWLLVSACLSVLAVAYAMSGG